MAPRAQLDDVITSIKSDVTALIEGEKELAIAEIQETGKRYAIPSGMFGAAGYLALNAISLLFIAGSIGIGILYHMVGIGPGGSAALGFLTMAVVLLIIVMILALVGKAKLKAAKNANNLEQTVLEAKTSVNAVKGAVARGKDDALMVTSKKDEATWPPAEARRAVDDTGAPGASASKTTNS